MRRPLDKLVLRGKDATGNGWFGASRGFREHKGVDYVGKVGDPVYACTSGIVRVGRVYEAEKKKKFKLVEITNQGNKHPHYKTQEMYVTPCVKTGDYVEEGELIGRLQAIGDFYGHGMPNHCHVKVVKNGLLTDPEPICL